MVDKAYLERMMIPPKFWTSSFDLVRSPQNRVVRKYIERFPVYREKGWGLLMWGDFSTGKSAASSVILKEAVATNGYTGLYVVAEAIPGYIIEKTPFDAEDTFMTRMDKVDLLVIDELILHKGDKFIDTVVESVFRRRLGNLKPTCLTTNLSPKVLAETYPALASVMTEAVYPVKFEGRLRDSHRDEIKKEFG